MPRPRAFAGCVVLAVVFAGTLAGCSGSGSGALAAQACAHVERGLAAAHKAAGSQSSAQAAQLSAVALAQIRGQYLSRPWRQVKTQHGRP